MLFTSTSKLRGVISTAGPLCLLVGGKRITSACCCRCRYNGAAVGGFLLAMCCDCDS